jgi:hypothetical protein
MDQHAGGLPCTGGTRTLLCCRTRGALPHPRACAVGRVPPAVTPRSSRAALPGRSRARQAQRGTCVIGAGAAVAGQAAVAPSRLARPRLGPARDARAVRHTCDAELTPRPRRRGGAQRCARGFSQSPCRRNWCGSVRGEAPTSWRTATLSPWVRTYAIAAAGWLLPRRARLHSSRALTPRGAQGRQRNHAAPGVK